MRLSEHSPEERATNVAYIDHRWKELADLQREAAASATTYLMVANSGGAVAVLSFMGAMKTTMPFAYAHGMLAAFLAGIVLVGIGKAVAYYHVTVRYRRWRDAVEHFFRDEWTWEQVLQHDRFMGWNYIVGDIIAWASFGCFVAGVGLGLSSIT